MEKRSKREEAMRVLRWAAELGVSSDEAKATLGRAELETLLDSKLLDEEERDFVQTALEATLGRRVRQIQQAGEDARAVVAGPTDTAKDVGPPEVRTRAESEEGSS